MSFSKVQLVSFSLTGWELVPEGYQEPSYNGNISDFPIYVWQEHCRQRPALALLYCIWCIDYLLFLLITAEDSRVWKPNRSLSGTEFSQMFVTYFIINMVQNLFLTSIFDRIVCILQQICIWWFSFHFAFIHIYNHVYEV